MNMEERFSPWYAWTQRETYPGISYPGVYAIAVSDANLAGKACSWRDELVYIGMTNAVHGLKGRLRQFDNTISMTRSQHGGAERFLFVYRDYALVLPQLYVAMYHVVCNPGKGSSDDQRKMGEVAQAEFVCKADYVDEVKHLPRFNDKKANKKFKFAAKGKTRDQSQYPLP